MLEQDWQGCHQQRYKKFWFVSKNAQKQIQEGDKPETIVCTTHNPMLFERNPRVDASSIKLTDITENTDNSKCQAVNIRCSPALRISHITFVSSIDALANGKSWSSLRPEFSNTTYDGKWPLATINSAAETSVTSTYQNDGHDKSGFS